MSKISLNQKEKLLEIEGFEIDSPIVFNYFDNLSSTERSEKLLKAIYIGVLALMEDRLSSFLSKTSNELGTELESLKKIFELKQHIFYKTSIKGNLAEEEIADFLNEFILQQGLRDAVLLTGNSAGKLPRNKTGDIVCNVNNDDNLKIVIECKFDKSIKLGDISTKDIFTKKTDTAWSQLLEATVNRDGKVSLIVFDESLVDNSITNHIQNISFIPEIGFIVLIDSQKGDYKNLAIAYMLARDIAVKSHKLDLDKNVLSILINRIIKDIGEILLIKKLVLNNIENNRQILAQLEKSILLMEFSQNYLTRFLKEGTLSKQDLLDFYSGEDIKDKFRIIEKEIEGI